MIELFDILKFEEGYRAKPYHCSEGYVTIGIGTKIGTKGAPLEQYTLTVSQRVAEVMLEEEVSSFAGKLKMLHWYANLNRDRQIIIESMCYQLGFNGVLKFKKMIAALESEDFNEAANQALDSLWARQTPARAERHAAVIAHGSLDEVYGGMV